MQRLPHQQGPYHSARPEDNLPQLNNNLHPSVLLPAACGKCEEPSREILGCGIVVRPFQPVDLNCLKHA